MEREGFSQEMSATPFEDSFLEQAQVGHTVQIPNKGKPFTAEEKEKIVEAKKAFHQVHERYQHPLVFENAPVLKRRKVGEDGVLEMEGIRYHLGSLFAGELVSVEPFKDELAVVIGVDDMFDEYLLGTFHLAPVSDKESPVPPPDISESSTQAKLWEELSDEEKQQLEPVQTYMRVRHNFDETGDLWQDVTPQARKKLLEYIDALDIKSRGMFFLSIEEGSEGIDAALRFLDLSAPELFGQFVEVALSLAPESRDVFYHTLVEISDARGKALATLQTEAAKTKGKQSAALRRERLAWDQKMMALVRTMEEQAKQSDSEPRFGTTKVFPKSLDTLLFLKILRSLLCESPEEFSLEQLEGVSLGQTTAASFTPEEKQYMLAIFDENWNDQDDVAREFFRGTLQKRLSNPSGATRFYVLRRHGGILAFLRFDEKPEHGEGVIYGGSLNIRGDFRGRSLGEAFMRQTIDEEAKEHVIEAHVVPDAVVGTSYVEHHHHVIVGVDRVETPRGPLSLLKLLRDDKVNGTYLARSPAAMHARPTEFSHELVATVEYTLPQDKEAMLARIESEVKNGFVVSRYGTDPRNPNKRFLAFEMKRPLGAQESEEVAEDLIQNEEMGEDSMQEAA